MQDAVDTVLARTVDRETIQSRSLIGLLNASQAIKSPILGLYRREKYVELYFYLLAPLKVEKVDHRSVVLQSWAKLV